MAWLECFLNPFPHFAAIEKLSKTNPIYNLNMAFKTAEEKLGICKLLDPEDVYTENGIPDGTLSPSSEFSQKFIL